MFCGFQHSLYLGSSRVGVLHLHLPKRKVRSSLLCWLYLESSVSVVRVVLFLTVCWAIRPRLAALTCHSVIFCQLLLSRLIQGYSGWSFGLLGKVLSAGNCSSYRGGRAFSLLSRDIGQVLAQLCIVRAVCPGYRRCSCLIVVKLRI